MNILITGAKGFIGQNLITTLRELPADKGLTLFPIDVDTDDSTLRDAASKADFVFHLAGVNRPKDTRDFMRGNGDFTQTLLTLLAHEKHPPVLLTSSTQASLDNDYGLSKRVAEDAVRRYGENFHTPVYLFRLTNVFGKWSRPNYNSAVATFCYNIARDLPITVSDPAVILKLVYIDDVVAAFLAALDGRMQAQNGFCPACPEYSIELGRLADTLKQFRNQRQTLEIPDQSDPFVRKLYATYVSFLPQDGFSYSLVTHADARGSFTEVAHMGGYGQISVNISKPHITKGDHWHHTKHEKFIVVSGTGVIRFRALHGDEVLAYPVNANPIAIVDIPPGYTHSIENTGENDLVTLMWASETFDPDKPDTFRLPVLETKA